MSRRLATLASFLLLLLALIIAQSANIQFFRASALDNSVNNPRGSSSPDGVRGQIIAADGAVLAESLPSPTSGRSYLRKYPLGSLTSDVVGYASPYYVAGLESYYNNYLSAHSQPAKNLVQVIAPSVASDNVNITLYPELQRIAQAAMLGDDGAAIVLNPQNGDILSLYSNPTFDPAPMTSPSYAVEEAAYLKGIKNDVHGFPPMGLVGLQQTFPPGSTFKVVTTAAASLTNPSLLFKSYAVGTQTALPGTNKVLVNDGGIPCGGTVAVMLPQSCDPGYALLGLDIGRTAMFNTAEAFGYNSTIPIDLPYSLPSYFPSAASFQYNQPFLAYSSIGQGNVRATALQQALVASAIADKGTIMVPHLMSSIIGPDGTVVKKYTPTVWKQPLKPAQATFIAGLMRGVVADSYGTANGVGFPAQDQVSAKTGTAQTGVGNLNTDDWMIAFAPASHPTVAVAVVMPYQAKTAYGSTVAGPIVKCLIEGALALQNGQPTSGIATSCRG